MFDRELEMLTDFRGALKEAERMMKKANGVMVLNKAYELNIMEKQDEINRLKTENQRLEFENKRLMADVKENSLWR